jgi:hypothetical protein
LLRIAKARINKILRGWRTDKEVERRRALSRVYGLAALDELCASASAPPSEEALRIDEVSGDPRAFKAPKLEPAKATS